jgi:hypothetical protein
VPIDGEREIMRIDDERLRHALEDAVARVGELPATGPGRIATVRTIADLAVAWPAPLGDESADTLQAICRKIAVAKKVYSEYAPGWAKLDGARAIDTAALRLLAVTLAAYASSARLEAGGLGLSLKLVNGALAAIDLGAAGGGDWDEVRRIAHAALDAALMEGPRCGA